MSFVPEDGTGLETANSYVTLAEANAYHADRNNTAWTGTDSVKQGALVRATDYIDQVYAGRWIGDPLNDVQALAWPRDEAGIPEKLKQAVCILALETIGGTALNPTQGREIKRRKVDVIETEYMDNARTRPSRPAIDQLLYGLITGGSALNAKVIRV